MSALSTPVRLSLAEARDLTDEVKADIESLYFKLKALHDGGAHLALGYSSWGDYFAEEFGQSARHGYRLLDAARVHEALSDPGVSKPPERAARELSRLLPSGSRSGPAPQPSPEQVAEVEEVWGEVLEEHGDHPTATEVREVVERHVPQRDANQQHKLVSGITEKARLIIDLAPHLDMDAIQAIPQEERDECKRQLSSARTVLSRVIAAL